MKIKAKSKASVRTPASRARTAREMRDPAAALAPSQTAKATLPPMQSDATQHPGLQHPSPPHPGSMLSVTHLTLQDVHHILELAADLEAEPVLSRAQRLLKRRIALLFYESSTRTRTSFELAAKSLGADTVLVSALSSSIEKGESLKDTGITLRALGAECIILRHPSSGAPYLLAQATQLPILNAGDGIHEHPSQALLDLRTILAHRLGAKQAQSATAQTLAGLTVTIVGDIFHSRVARSNALLLPRLGARVVLCGPEPLLPESAAAIGPNLTIDRNLDRALAQSDVVMMLRIQKERLSGLRLDLEDYITRYQLDAARLAAHAPKALVLHPGPIIRGLELTSEVADGPQSTVAEQVHHGLAIRMALLARALEATKTSTNKTKATVKTVKKSTRR